MDHHQAALLTCFSLDKAMSLESI
jgi:hypothetical protein